MSEPNSSESDATLDGILELFALPPEEIAEQLKNFAPDQRYVLDDAGLETSSALVACAYVAWQRIDHASWGAGDRGEVLMDLAALLLMMFETRDKYEYIWRIDKNEVPVSGPLDRLWSLVRRLAALASRSETNENAANIGRFLSVIGRRAKWEGKNGTGPDTAR